MEFVLGGCAGCFAGFFTNPLDVVKTRMQLQGELRRAGKYTKHYRNVFHALYAVGRSDGVLALQKGLGPALSYQLVMNGTRLGIFQVLEDTGVMRTGGVLTPWKCVLGGAAAGAVAGYLASPLYMVKVRIQTQSVLGVGHQHAHTRMASALRSVFSQHGVRGLWRGSMASLPRVMVGSTAQLTTFSEACELIEQARILPPGSLWGTLAASMLSGVVVALFMTPFDVVATRLYNQGVDASGRGMTYRGYGDCLLRILTSEGPRGFYKGLTGNWLRVGPHSVLNMCCWTYLKGKYRAYRAPDEL